MKLSIAAIPLFYVTCSYAALDPTILAQHLANGADLLGATRPASTSQLAKWMASIDDATPIENMTIPGTHDSLTWSATGVTAQFVQTQDKSLFDQLDAGIRFFDLRIGLNGANINLYHGAALLSPTVILEDIFWGFYSWIDSHPTETLIVSVKVDNGTTGADVQQPVHDLLTTGVGADYWLQTDTLGTLGASRGKLYLFRRITLDTVTGAAAIGIPAATGFQDNQPDFVITNGAKSIAIEDYYNVAGGTIGPSVDAKFAAVSAHLDSARASQDPSRLFLTFASGTSGLSVNPKMLAGGNTTSQEPGVNSKVLSYLQSHRGEHMGVIMYDFYASENGLVNATLGYDVSATAPSGSTTTGTGAGASPTGKSPAVQNSIPKLFHLFALVPFVLGLSAL